MPEDELWENTNQSDSEEEEEKEEEKEEDSPDTQSKELVITEESIDENGV